jgi:cytosine/adenosine deaminase-related metal-dependent hydrolase
MPPVEKENTMMELDINEVVSKLWNLRSYSKELSQRMEHEEELPDDAVPFLVERIENAFTRCEAATVANKADAHEVLAEWLIRSYRFYVCRLVKFDTPWVFTFPKADVYNLH